MESKFEYFLLVAEELNISRVAKKMFITQQSISQHIKQLEKDFNTILFFRKPKLSLTPAGKMLAETIENIKILEENFKNRLHNANKDYSGSLNIGISHSRANILMPVVIPIYQKTWPNIQLNLQYNNTYENLENRIIRGYLDIFIGISDFKKNDNLEVVTLQEEKVYIIISENIFKKYLGHLFPGCPKYPSFGIFLDSLSKIPFILNTEDELSYKIYNHFFKEYNVRLHSIMNCNDSHLRMAMCVNDIGATIAVEAMLKHLFSFNNKFKQSNRLLHFPIPRLKVPSVLAYHRKRFLPEHTKELITIVENSSKNYYKLLKQIDAKSDKQST